MHFFSSLYKLKEVCGCALRGRGKDGGVMFLCRVVAVTYWVIGHWVRLVLLGKMRLMESCYLLHPAPRYLQAGVHPQKAHFYIPWVLNVERRRG